MSTIWTTDPPEATEHRDDCATQNGRMGCDCEELDYGDEMNAGEAKWERDGLR